MRDAIPRNHKSILAYGEESIRRRDFLNRPSFFSVTLHQGFKLDFADVCRIIFSDVKRRFHDAVRGRAD